MTLNVIEVGAREAPAIVFLHGLRDSAHALIPMIEPHLTDSGQYRALLLEHRGHGASDATDAYAMPNFLVDVLQVIQQCARAPVALFGHSLGGHVATKFAALFPEWVHSLIVVEGLGPPQRPHEGDIPAELAAYRDMLLNRFTPPSTRVLPSIDHVYQKLLANNPRLAPQAAEQLARHLTRETPAGLMWAFDSRAQSVFTGTSHADNVRYWQHVTAPTCLVSGRLSYQYWGQQMAGPAFDNSFDGSFAEGEMEARAALFANAEHHWFEQSGHMVHYDEGDRLGRLCQDFLSRTGYGSASDNNAGREHE